MVRHTQPQLIEMKPLERSERASLALFLGELQQEPQLTAAQLSAYKRASEVITAAAALDPDDESQPSKVLRVTADMLSSEADRKVHVDTITLGIAQFAIKQASMERPLDADERRMRYVSAFAGQVAAWDNYYGVVADVAVDWGLRTDAAPALRVIESQLAEIGGHPSFKPDLSIVPRFDPDSAA